MSMRILLNINEQIAPAMIENHFRAISVESTVTVTSKDMMLEILQAYKMDMVVYYADKVDSCDLLNFFSKIRSVDPNILLVLFVKKENLCMVGETLEFYLNECFAIPMDSNELIIRLRRVMQASERQNFKPAVPQQQQKIQFAPQPVVNPVQPAAWQYNQPETPQPPQEVQIIPQPVANPVQPAAWQYNQPETPQQPQVAQILPQPFANPVQPAAWRYNQPETPEQKQEVQSDVQPAANPVQPLTRIYSQPEPPREPETGREKIQTGKSPLRHLNKIELLEIILEQEKRMASLDNKIEELKRQIENREIIIEDSGSIAEAALKLNGIFEAAQKAADQYLESVKLINIRSIKLVKNEEKTETGTRELG